MKFIYVSWECESTEVIKILNNFDNLWAKYYETFFLIIEYSSFMSSLGIVIFVIFGTGTSILI